MNILLVQSIVKIWHEIQWGPINQDGGSTSVEGGTGRESHPDRGEEVKSSYHKTQSLPVISGLVK